MKNYTDTLKYIWYALYSAWIAVLLHYNINPKLFLALWVLMMIDTILWGMKAWRLWIFTSRDLKRWVAGKVVWLIIVFAFWVLSKLVVQWEFSTWFVNIVMMLFGISEVISSIQNSIVFKTWENITESDAITNVMRFLLEKLKKILDQYINIK